MRTLKIGFSKNKYEKIGSVVIQRVLGRDYSHTFFEFNTKHIFDDNTIFHSSMASGVSYWSNIKFEEQNIKVAMYEIEMEDNLYKELRNDLHKKSGNSYAHLQNLGILLVDFLQDLGVNISNPFRKGENCSELVYTALLKLHPELNESYKKNTIRPDHIEEILKKYSYKKLS